jgi:vanillate O-demethylase monooxygenase subunit
MFLKNAWYVACLPKDLQDKPFGRKICNEDVVLYRGGDGVVHALEDYCPHRGTPLSLGFLSDGELVCGYHGLKMGCEGKTISMPGQRVRAFPTIRVFPVIEKYGFIWLWPGDPKLATEEALPHLEWFDNPQWAYAGGLYHVKCNYQLMVDNLMDLTHETYVHSDSIGQKEIDETPCVTEVDGNHVSTSRFMENIMPPPFWKMALKGNGLADDVPVDRWQICRFSPPSHIILEVGVAHAGKGGYNAPDEHKVYSRVIDFLTPETDTSLWYFWGMARKFNPQDTELTKLILEGQGKIFSEDTALLEYQQKSLLNHPNRTLLKLNIDAGGVQSRKVIERLVMDELASSS